MTYFALQLLTVWKPTRSNLSKLFLLKYSNNNKCHLYGRILCAQFKLSPHNSFNFCAHILSLLYERIIQMLCDEFIEIFSLWVIYRVWIVCYKFTCVSRVCSFTRTTLIIRFWFDHIEITHVKTCADKILSLQWFQGLRRLGTFSSSIKKKIVRSDAQEQTKLPSCGFISHSPPCFFLGITHEPRLFR